MTIRTNYFDETSYSASDAVAPFASLVANGVYNVRGGNLLVTANSPADLSINVSTGTCTINGYFINSDSVTNVPITTNTSGYNRIDIIVVEVDTINKLSTIKCVEGTPNSSPSVPIALPQQLTLAQVFVGNNVSVINTSNVTDMRILADTSTIQADSINRQALINGNFDIWQRGTSFSTVNGYTADRWRISSDGTGQVSTISRQAFSTSTKDIVPLPRYFWRYQITTASATQTYTRIYQKIEDVRKCSGQWVTMSFYIKADTTRNITVTLQQSFGSGGSPSASVNAIVSSVSIGTAWQQVVIPVFVPSISGKVIGTNEDSYLLFAIDFPTKTTMTFDIAQAQINAGVVPLPYCTKSFIEELSDCMRYYEKSYDYSRTPGQMDDNGQIVVNYGTNAGIRRIPVFYNVRKRTIPTVVMYDGAGTANRISVLDSVDAITSNITAYAVQYSGENGFSLSSSTASKSGAIFHWTADAEL